jgi:serine/threonine-protein kinase
MIGEAIGRFELRSRLGEGPFGEVWLAGHRETQEAAAIKLLHPAVSALPALPAFVAATRAIARIANAGIGKVLDVGVGADGRAYVVSEFILGQTLGQRIAQGRLSQTQVADVVAQLARALAAAQGVGVVHHDLKTSNVVLVPDPDRPTGERVVVLDFGLAPLVAADLERAAPAYVAPELWSRGELPAEPSSPDIYALVCLAFQMAAGRPPFLAPTHARLREKHLHDPAPSIRSLMPDIGAVLDRLVARMLEKQPADRLRSFKDIAKLFDLLVGPQAPLGETVQD